MFKVVHICATLIIDFLLKIDSTLLLIHAYFTSTFFGWSQSLCIITPDYVDSGFKQCHIFFHSLHFTLATQNHFILHILVTPSQIISTGISLSSVLVLTTTLTAIPCTSHFSCAFSSLLNVTVSYHEFIIHIFSHHLETMVERAIICFPQACIYLPIEFLLTLHQHFFLHL